MGSIPQDLGLHKNKQAIKSIVMILRAEFLSHHHSYVNSGEKKVAG